MIKKILSAARRNRALRALHRGISDRSTDILSKCAEDDDEVVRLSAQAARAVLLIGGPSLKEAQAALNRVYGSVKNPTHPEYILIKMYCLYHLAALRGAHADCFVHAKKAKAIAGVKNLRKAICMPAPVERTMIGSFVTAMR